MESAKQRCRRLAICLATLIFFAPASLMAQQNSPASGDEATASTEVQPDLMRAKRHAEEGNLDKAAAVCEHALQANPDDFELLLLMVQLADARGNKLVRNGQEEEGYALYIKAGENARRLREKHPNINSGTRKFIATAQYNAACGHALSEQVPEAFTSLRGAILSGFDDLELMVGDEDLKTLRNNPEFLRLVRELKDLPSVQARLLRREASRLMRSGNYEQAIAKLGESLALLRTTFSKEEYPDGHPKLADVLSDLGVVHKRSNEFERAKEFLEQAYEMRKRLYPPQRFPDGHADLATSLNDLASLLRARGNPAGAVDYFRRALEMKVQLYPAEKYPNGHSSIAIAMVNLAITLEGAGRAAEAHDYYLQQLAMTRKIYATPQYPDGHSSLVRALSLVGHSLRKQGQLADATTHAQQALEMVQRLYPASAHPKGHLLVAECLNDHGLVLHLRGRLAEAEERFRAAHAMFLALYPGERGHPTIFYGLINLGDIADERGAYVEAEQWFRKAREMQLGFYPKQRFPNGHPAMAQTLSKLAGALDGQNRRAEAMPLHEAALEILRHAYPPSRYPNGHPDLARGQSNLAIALRNLSKNIEAQRLHETALQSRRKLYPTEEFPKGHPDIASSLNNLATLLLVNGNPAAALDLYQQHLKMIEGFHPRDRFPRGHPNLANALTNIGQTHGELGNHMAARPLLERALEMWHVLYPNGHPDIPRTQDVLGVLLDQQGQPAAALQHFTDALLIRERLFPTKDYPDGHVDLTDSLSHLSDVMAELNNFPKSKEYADRMLDMTRRLYTEREYPGGHLELAFVLSKTSDAYSRMGRLLEAEELMLESLAIRQHLYPPGQYPLGHIMIARGLNNLALRYGSQGRHERARNYYDRSIAMRRSLYPIDQYPQGHADLARGLNNQGSFLESLGEYDAAKRLHEEALAMRKRLYPPEKYPRGHRDLALSHHNLGIALQGRGRLDDAERHLRSELRILGQLYPLAEYDNGHPGLAGCLNTLGSIARAKREWKQARELFEQALSMRRQLYTKNGKTFDHPEVSESLNNVANICADQGDYAAAESSQTLSVEMDRRLYPQADFPHGHPSLAAGIANLGSLNVEMGRPQRGIPLQIEAVDMQYALARVHVGGASEAESLNFVARHLSMPHSLISAWDQAKQPDKELYQRIWLRKGMVHRLMAQRNRAMHAARDVDEDELYERYLSARRGIARLILASGDSSDKQRHDRLESLRVLSAEKERIERELAGRIPEFAKQLVAQETSPAELAESLPSGTVFVDLVTYFDSNYDSSQPGADGATRQWEIAAFVVARDQPVVRIPLGELAPVREHIEAWRRAIATNQTGREMDELRDQLWRPLESHFPAGTETVVLCPDGVLTALPWAALPGKRPRSVLLEDYAIAFVPYGPFLLETSDVDPTADVTEDPGLFLAVGDVAYDAQPTAIAPANLIAQRDATVASGTLSWPELPGAREELEDVIAAAKNRRTVSLLQDEASTARTIKLLPSASGVHFATHGFFADARFQSALQLDDRLFEQSNQGGERSSVAGRNPLALTGLVLAGANLPPKTDPSGLQQDEGGVLTGEVIAALPLGKMRLAVLSACETGLGEVAGGEGVFGLQRAFHIAGAQNVVASLWKVDDHATAALMRLFYYKLWTEKKPPLQALRESQLAIYRHPDQIEKLSTSRGPNFNKVVKMVDRLPENERPKTAPTKMWASFVLSGLGR